MTFRRMLNTYTDLSSLNDLGQRAARQLRRVGHRAGRTVHTAYDRGRDYYQENLKPRQQSNRGSVISAASCAALAVGAGLMYCFDPTLGRRRRHHLRDKLVHSVHEIGDCLDATARDFANRSKGLYHSVAALFGSQGAAPDHVIEDRVRSTLRRHVSHPRAVQVWSDDGHVILCGTILEEELKPALKAVAGVSGVRSVQHQVESRASRGNEPALQGGAARPAAGLGSRRENWSPTTGVMAGFAGTTLLGWAAASRSIPSLVGGVFGLGLLARSATNLSARRMIGAGAGRRAIDIRKTVNISAPVDVVYGFWSNYENFPLFMSNVREVRDYGDGISHWVVAGPAGLKVEWDAILTDLQPNRCIAWKSAPGEMIGSAGQVQFQENQDGTTRVDVRMSYNPPGGALGHAVAALFASDPKSEMDGDLARMKTLIERGRFPHDAAQHLTDAGTTTTVR